MPTAPWTRILAYVRDWWRWVLAEWPLARLDMLQVGWGHGDYHGRNMVLLGMTCVACSTSMA